MTRGDTEHWPSPSNHPLFTSLVPQLHHGAPILVHLNADTSWLLLIPRPALPPASSESLYFKLLIDPWFAGAQVDYYAWFSSQTHAIRSCVQDIVELEQVLRGIERVERQLASKRTPPLAADQGTAAAADPHLLPDAHTHLLSHQAEEASTQELDNAGQMPVDGSHTSYIDAVLVSHEFSDHCHRETLTQLPATMPVIAGPAAAKLIRTWKHFTPETVYAMRPLSSCLASENPKTRNRLSLFSSNGGTDDRKAGREQGPDWRLAAFPGLPDWLSVSQIFSPQRMSPKPSFHAGALIAFSKTRGRHTDHQKPDIDEFGEGVASAVIYTPHGLTTAAVDDVVRAAPRIETLALLQGLDEMQLLGGLLQLNLGARQGLQVARSTAARYWLGTHEEDKVARGIVAKTMQRAKITLAEVIEEEMRKNGEKGKVVGPGDAKGSGDVLFTQLGNGEALALLASA